MDDFEFRNPTKIVFGRGAEAKVGAQAAAHSRKCCCTTAAAASRIRPAARVLASLQGGRRMGGAGRRQAQSAPLLVREGVRLCKQHGLGLVLAIGGGSAIDSAKAIAMGAVIDGDVWDFYLGKGAPVAALPVGHRFDHSGGRQRGEHRHGDHQRGRLAQARGELRIDLSALLDPQPGARVHPAALPGGLRRDRTSWRT